MSGTLCIKLQEFPLTRCTLSCSLSRTTSTEGIIHSLPLRDFRFWSDLLPATLHPPWRALLKHWASSSAQGSSSKGKVDALDQAVAQLFPFFHSDARTAAVRLPTDRESLTLCGISDVVPPTLCNGAPVPSALQRSLAGNSFHPAAILSVLGGEEALRAFVFERVADYAVPLKTADPDSVATYFHDRVLPLVREQRKESLQHAWKGKSAPSTAPEDSCQVLR